MGDNLDNTSNGEQGLTSDCPSSADDAQVSQATRRKFTRNVVVGGAVLASLGNRAAWGVIGDPAPGCRYVRPPRLSGNQRLPLHPLIRLADRAWPCA